MATVDGVSVLEMEQVKAGNPLVFEALYNRYKRTVYALCLQSTKDVADAEDLTQEVFLQVYRRVSTLRDAAAFKSWLFRVTTNIILMHSRRRKTLPISLHYTLSPDTTGVGDIVQTLISPTREPIEGIALARAIGDLPKCRRIVLVLHDIKGMSHREIAASLGVSLNTTKSNLSRAHHQLRGILRKDRFATGLPTSCGGAPEEPNDRTQSGIHAGQLQVGSQLSACETQSGAFASSLSC
jgi:RNA polymerase sigma-70 factor, ECF subfamily